MVVDGSWICAMMQPAAVAQCVDGQQAGHSEEVLWVAQGAYQQCAGASTQQWTGCCHWHTHAHMMPLNEDLSGS